MCERGGLNYEQVAMIVYRYEHPTTSNGPVRSIEFNIADRLLCAMGAWGLWYTEFAEYYEHVNLRIKQCSHPDCVVMFEPTTGPGTLRGGRDKMFCSRACANSAAQGNIRRKKTNVRPEKGFHASRCRNGHERTEENTILLKSGKIRCRICNNACSNRSHHRRKGAPNAA